MLLFIRHKFAKNTNTFRAKFLDRQETKEHIPLSLARERKLKLDWDSFSPVAPQQLGVQVIEQQDLDDLVPYIDWSPFFPFMGFTWTLPSHFKRRDCRGTSHRFICRCSSTFN